MQVRWKKQVIKQGELDKPRAASALIWTVGTAARPLPISPNPALFSSQQLKKSP